MRLIDADALVHDLVHNRSFYPVCVRKAIEDAPTVDAVEVVRCKDCKRWRKSVCLITGFMRSGENFCSYGERRTDSATD